jgi:co-chaperonin GroES (HSP10)
VKFNEWTGSNLIREIEMKVIPLNGRVLLKRIEEQQVNKGGIIIPDTERDKRWRQKL